MDKALFKIIIVKRPTRLDNLVYKFNTRQQVKFYIEHLGADFTDYEKEHTTYYKALDTLLQIAETKGRIQLLDWSLLSNYLFGNDDLVLTIGQDGLIANTLKYLDNQLLIGFNSDPDRWDGILSQFTINEANTIIDKALHKNVAVKKITKAKVELSDKQVLYAVNDFFVGVSDHTSARYTIHYSKNKEYQSSSGIIISTPLGTSGWFQSLIAGAAGIVKAVSSSAITIEKETRSWSEDALTFVVREPFPSVSTKAELVFGTITHDNAFYIESNMGEKGIIFSDGIQNDFLHFNSSLKAQFTIAETKGTLVIKDGGPI